MLTNKENYLRVLNRECPESVPTSAMSMFRPSILNTRRNPNGSGFDQWGIEYVISEESGFAGGFIPKPGEFMLEDITKWRDVLTAPDLTNVDWEAMAKKDMENIDRDRAPVASDAVTGFFQALINYMGFTEGLCACYEEPEEVKAIMEWHNSINLEIAKNIIKYYKPDMLWLPDDVATARSPFISQEMFQELFKPYWKQYTELFLDAGIPCQLHCCGECTILLDDFVDCGFTAWDPAQVMNDLVAVKAKYGNNFAIVGGWDGTGRVADPDTTEEEVRALVREKIDTLGAGGGFVWQGGVNPRPDMPNLEERIAWIYDEVAKYGTNYYAK